MKILIVNQNDFWGGAARAARRLHHALLSEGVQSRMIVQEKYSDCDSIVSIASDWDKQFPNFRPLCDSLMVRLYRDRKKQIFSPSIFPGKRIVRFINESDADVVNLHWFCSGMLSIEDVAGIEKPIVWTLHDNWAFSGGCHIMGDCGSYRKQCGSCPILGSSREHDLSRWIWKRKKRSYHKQCGMQIVGPSKWIADCAKESSLLKNHLIKNIKNPIDTNFYKTIPKEFARDLLGLPKEKKIIAFGAMSATRDPNKGYKYLVEALNLLKLNNVECLVFGSERPASSVYCMPTHFVGRVMDDFSLRLIYCSADAVIVPSKQENLSNVIMESLSCGCPVIAFNIGGNSDLIVHKENGFMASPFDSSELSYGIEWVLNHSNYFALSEFARTKIKQECCENVIAKEYLELYKMIRDKGCLPQKD